MKEDRILAEIVELRNDMKTMVAQVSNIAISTGKMDERMLGLKDRVDGVEKTAQNAQKIGFAGLLAGVGGAGSSAAKILGLI